jgi:hypothetical protein
MTTGTGVVASCTDAVNYSAETGGTGYETAHSDSVFGLESSSREVVAVG